MKKEIENPWCVYVSATFNGIGKIKEEGNCLIIGHSENGPYVPWNPNCITRFSTLKQAIKHYEETTPPPEIILGGLSSQEFREIVKRNFPSYFKE